MFGIRRKKKKINGAPPGYFTNELHEFTFNTPKMRMGHRRAEQKKNKKNRHKGEREIYTSWEGKSHSGWDTLKRIIIRLMKPTRIMSGCCCNPSLFLSLFVFFFYFSFLLREEVKKKRNG